MSHDDMKNYRDVLRHVVRPDNPAERTEADSVTLRDYEALYLYEAFVEYAAYEADNREAEQIALGYAEYVNMVVREEGRNRVRLYAHTDEAQTVLIEALDARQKYVSGLQTQIHEKLREAFYADS